MAINVTIDGTLYEDVEVITVGGKTLLLAYSADSGSGDNGSGDSGGDTGGDTGGSVEATLPTNGLYAFADFRNAEVQHGDWWSTVVPTQGSAKEAVYFNTTQNSTTSNEHGIASAMTLCTESAYPNDTNTVSMGTEFSVATLSYDESFTSPLMMLNQYGAMSNSKLCVHAPTYNKSAGGTGGVDSINSKLDRAAGWHSYVLVANGTKLDIYVDGQLDASVDGSECEDFASWVSIMKFKQTATTTHNVVTAIYNKSLSGVEVVELVEYLKTLEVA